MKTPPQDATTALIEQLDAIQAVDYCDCGRPKSEHEYWVDRIYDYNGYSCPGPLRGDYRFSAIHTARHHKEARAAKLADHLAALSSQAPPQEIAPLDVRGAFTLGGPATTARTRDELVAAVMDRLTASPVSEVTIRSQGATPYPARTEQAPLPAPPGTGSADT